MLEPEVDDELAERLRQRAAAADELRRREVAAAYDRGCAECRRQALQDAIEQVRRSSSPQDAERRIVELDAEEGS